MPDEVVAPAMPPEQSDAKPWYNSTQIRVALTVVIVPASVRIAQHTALGRWLAEYTGIDILTIKAEDIVDWLMLAISAIGGTVWIHHRVKAGRPGQPQAAQLIPPVIVQRLTGDTPIVKD